MAEVTQQVSTENRKVDHVRINLEKDVSFPRLTTGLEKYRFLHRALPELNLAEINIRQELFGKLLSAPVLISSMTGGAGMAFEINRNLAIAAQATGIAMGLGSQRAALEDSALEYTFRIRDVAPDILLFANVGAVQLNYGYDASHLQRAVDMAQADALILHFNVLQEAVQPEGDTDFSGLLAKIEKVCASLGVPVIAKEVGWGFSQQDVRALIDAGVSAIDVAGSGGTSWSEVEYHRAPTEFHANVARAFADWGISTADAILYAAAVSGDKPVFASGGLRDGIDVAKSIALGASLGGLASPFLRAAVESADAVISLVNQITAQLRIAMLCAGVRDLDTLKQLELIKE